MVQSHPLSFTPDPTQQHVIDLTIGRHLVLAPPGCGKTQLLAERIRQAHAQGVSYDDMLCLTFTNRAARGMRERINQNLNDNDTQKVFVGNVHRFCTHFLFENALVAQECSVIDDETFVSILATYMNEDEKDVMKNQNRRRRYNEIMQFSHLMYEIRHGIPRDLRLHPESISKDDIAVLKSICNLQQRPFTAEAMVEIYDHNTNYSDFIEQDGFDITQRGNARILLEKMKYAHAYEAYKTQNHLLDFEDLLQMTYIALRDQQEFKRYRWIQVDEVQDLNFMQLAIVDMLSACRQADSEDGTILYLGDEQQAIFSFMGAKLQTLTWLKEQCAGHVHHLGINHRSPRYIVELLNAFAVNELHSDPALLPQPQGNEEAPEGALQIVGSRELKSEYDDVARMVRKLIHDYPGETTAIIVNSNADADLMSERLQGYNIDHFKVSGEDLFTSNEVKLMLAHLSVLANERNFLAWSRLLVGLKICESQSSARRLAHQLEKHAISPTDFFLFSDSTYVQEFVSCYEEQDIIVFDTETTGLNIFEDDVIQIAAERLRQGKRVAKFSVHITTSRPIPTMLGDTVNPIIAEREQQTLVSPEQALLQFLAFAEGGVLLAHNAEFDYPIMRQYMERNLPQERWQARFPCYFDSLKLIRLLRPDLKAYKLKLLLEELGLEGQNSHLADDDVFATVSLVGYCYEKGKEIIPLQISLLSKPGVHDQINKFRRNYGEIYADGRSRLYVRTSQQAKIATSQGEVFDPQADNSLPALVAEIQRFYAAAKENGWVGEQPRLRYIYQYLAHDVIDAAQEPSLIEQLSHHIMELNTFKEADLCGSEAISDRLFVSTIHKAKGLEFDNVIVFDVIDGRIPNYYNENNPTGLAEDARKLYVAMSRAKRRLIITHSETRVTAYSTRPLQLSRFLASIGRYFTFS